LKIGNLDLIGLFLLCGVMNNHNIEVISFYSNEDDLIMIDYKINVFFSEDNISLDDIFTKVLLKELLMVLKNQKNAVKSSCTYLSLSKERGKNWII